MSEPDTNYDPLTDTDWLTGAVTRIANRYIAFIHNHLARSSGPGNGGLTTCNAALERAVIGVRANGHCLDAESWGKCWTAPIVSCLIWPHAAAALPHCDLLGPHWLIHEHERAAEGTLLPRITG